MLQTTTAKRGMVVAPHHLAAQAGLALGFTARHRMSVSQSARRMLKSLVHATGAAPDVAFGHDQATGRVCQI
jgi:hypothetical protein